MPQWEMAAAPKEAGFIDFYRDEYQGAVRLAYRLAGSEQVAEDVVRGVFVATRERFRQLPNPTAYLRLEIVRRCRATWHHDRIHRLRARRAPLPPHVASTLFGALMALPHRQRAVLVLRYWSDWSDVEIGQALGCRPATVGRAARRGLVRLQRETRR